MKRHQKLMLEWNNEKAVIKEFEVDALSGTLGGAGIGLMGTGAVWISKRRNLEMKKQQCKDQICIDRINQEIKQLNDVMLKFAPVSALGGASIGGLAGKSYNDYQTNNTLSFDKLLGRI